MHHQPKSDQQQQEARLKATVEPLQPISKSTPRLRTFAPPSAALPFRSSLIDTVAVEIDVKHVAFASLAASSPHMHRQGNRFVVVSSYGTKARVKSLDGCNKIAIETSVAKFTWGQSIFGSHNLPLSCRHMILTVLSRMGLQLTAAERKKIADGDYRLTRVDVATHCQCENEEQAAALMFALRSSVWSHGRDVSAYGTETVYVGQHSRVRSLRVYRKDIEVAHTGIPKTAYRAAYLSAAVVGLVRIELVLRAVELARLHLDRPKAWSDGTVNLLLEPWIARLARAPGVVSNFAVSEPLGAALRAQFSAWLLGDALAFSRGCTRATYRARRKRVRDAIGVDIDGPPDVNLQRHCLSTVAGAFERGLGFQDHAKQWGQWIKRGLVRRLAKRRRIQKKNMSQRRALKR